MNENEKIKFGILLTGLSEVFNQPLSTAGVDIYWQILKVYTLEEVEKAILKLVSSNTFMPKVGEIITVITGKTKNQGLAAWGDFIGLLNRYGGLRNKVLEVNITMAETVKRLGGWTFLARKNSYELESLKNSFIAIYEASLASPQNNASLTIGEIMGERTHNWVIQTLEPLTKIKLNKQFEEIKEKKECLGE